MKAINLISIPVTDQQRAKEFYKKLGFEVLVEAPMNETQMWIQMAIPGNEVSVALVNWFEKMPAGCVQGFIIKTDDIQKEISELESKGVKVEPLEQTPWGKFALVRDPDGNGLSLHQE